MTSKAGEIKRLICDVDQAIVTAVKLRLTIATYLLKMAKLDLQEAAEDIGDLPNNSRQGRMER
jgi:hypothetical protein